jgi:fluoride ion exporter CrcB/FEX
MKEEQNISSVEDGTTINGDLSTSVEEKDVIEILISSIDDQIEIKKEKEQNSQPTSKNVFENDDAKYVRSMQTKATSKESLTPKETKDVSKRRIHSTPKPSKFTFDNAPTPSKFTFEKISTEERTLQTEKGSPFFDLQQHSTPINQELPQSISIKHKEKGITKSKSQPDVNYSNSMEDLYQDDKYALVLNNDNICKPGVSSPKTIEETIHRSDTPIIENTLGYKVSVDKRAVELNKGFDATSNDVSVEEAVLESNNSFDTTSKSLKVIDSPTNSIEAIDSVALSTNSLFSFFQCIDVMSILFLAAFAVIGSFIRVYLGRIFGYDCEFPLEGKDFASVFATCVTASGTTDQRGGALFIDLPSNMIGSFILGILTPIGKDVPALPWLKQNHPLQSNTKIHTSMRTGLCGSITTFSSWNTQMVVMMIGKGTTLGVQIVPALFGYFIGMVSAIASFLYGRRFAKFLYCYRHPNQNDDMNIVKDIESHDQISQSADSSSDDDNGNKCSIKALEMIDCIFNGTYSSIIFTALLLFFFLIGGFAMGNKFHQVMGVTCLLSPLGTIIRWRLSSLNGKWFQQSAINCLKYLPVGTLICNVCACLISVLCAALLLHTDDENRWRLILDGIKLGFAGNLSTVSTFVKEIVHLSETEQAMPAAHIYAVGTLVISCSVSLIIYTSI